MPSYDPQIDVRLRRGGDSRRGSQLVRAPRSDQISEHTPGVGWVVVDDMPEPVRVRFAHVTDSRIERAVSLPS